MIEDAKVLEDGPALESTNSLCGLAAVGNFAATIVEAVAMSETGKCVSVRGKFYVPSDHQHRQAERRIRVDNLLEI